MTILPALALGLVLGMRHATDADHIAAVGTLLVEERSWRRATLVGAVWGLGHSASVMLVGGALVVLRLPMPARVALALEFAAALMLIGLGVRALVVRRVAGHAGNTTRPLLVGIMHGLAGSAVLALLVLGTTESALAGGVYLACFSAGTVAGMALVTALLGATATGAWTRVAGFERALRVAAGVASLAIGLLMAHRVGVQDGLFAATPRMPQ